MELSNRCALWFAFGDTRVRGFACCARRRLWRRKLLHLLTLTAFSYWTYIFHLRKCERGVGCPRADLRDPGFSSHGVPLS